MRKASYQGLFLQVAERKKKKIWPQATEYTSVQFNLSHWPRSGRLDPPFPNTFCVSPHGLICLYRLACV